VILDLELLEGFVGATEAEDWDVGNGVRHGVAQMATPN
jgi:hypothetical protein